MHNIPDDYEQPLARRRNVCAEWGRDINKHVRMKSWGSLHKGSFPAAADQGDKAGVGRRDEHQSVPTFLPGHNSEFQECWVSSQLKVS
jgi:hypothetical protein